MLFSLIFFVGVFLIAGCKKEDPERKKDEVSVSAKEKTNPATKNPSAFGADGNTDSANPRKGDTSASQSDATGIHWLTNYEKAKAQAAQDGKDLVLNFSGSDWCIFCIKLEKEIFSQDEFAREAENYFVFLLVDFPYDTSGQSEELQKHNERLARMYGFRGLFPTIYLASADGRPYAVAEYKPVGPKAYLDYLLQIKKYRDR